MTTITLDEAKERIRRLAEERPDYVYEPVKAHEGDHAGICRYFDNDGNPSCIIGHAFADELRTLTGIEGRSALSVLRDLRAEAAAERFAHTVQIRQDAGDTWGEAYRRGLTHVGAE